MPKSDKQVLYTLVNGAKVGLPQFYEGDDPVEISTKNPLPVQIAGGGVGGSAMEFLNGSGEPAADAGNDGDVYLNTSNGDFYQKDGDWEKLMNLKGPKGDKGAAGPKGDAGADGNQGPKGDQGPAGKDAENQFTSDEVAKIKDLISDSGE